MNGEKLLRKPIASFFSSQVQKLQNKTFLRFIYDFKLCFPNMVAPTSLQQTHPKGKNTASAAHTETVIYFINFQDFVSQTLSTNDTEKLPLHSKINFGSFTHRNLIL